jgi:uncharacterized membrane protein
VPALLENSYFENINKQYLSKTHCNMNLKKFFGLALCGIVAIMVIVVFIVLVGIVAGHQRQGCAHNHQNG